ncbi:MAG: DNA gyrase C-terminal beta-propeller domain-containing protein, partial [Cyanobacteriota bacterium]
VLVGLKVLGAGEELLLVSERGVIVRMQSNAVPQQSRAATGVRLQRLDAGDRLTEVVLVPPAAAEVEEEGAGIAEVSTGTDAELLADPNPEDTAEEPLEEETEEGSSE